MCPLRRSLLFSSHEYSMTSVLISVNVRSFFHGFVYAFGSSIVTRVGDVAGVGAAQRLDHVQRVAVRMADRVEPRVAVEADGVDDERVAVPPADRVAEPRRLDVLRMFAVDA